MAYLIKSFCHSCSSTRAQIVLQEGRARQEVCVAPPRTFLKYYLFLLKYASLLNKCVLWLWYELNAYICKPTSPIMHFFDK